VIAGGLIEEKAEVIAALDAGAMAVSKPTNSVWRM
jgi:glycerol-3-phosphate responsive antiterminator